MSLGELDLGVCSSARCLVLGIHSSLGWHASLRWRVAVGSEGRRSILRSHHGSLIIERIVAMRWWWRRRRWRKSVVAAVGRWQEQLRVDGRGWGQQGQLLVMHRQLEFLQCFENVGFVAAAEVIGESVVSSVVELV